jgi:hypothetical protein
VGVHFLRKLARDLDRLDLRGKGATEDPFDEALDARFEISQDADGSCSLGAGTGPVR